MTDQLTQMVLDEAAEAYQLCAQLVGAGILVHRQVPPVLTHEHEYNVTLDRIAAHPQARLAIGFLASWIVTAIDDDVPPSEVVEEIVEMGQLSLHEFEDLAGG